jgi:hypothetical protein
MTAAYAAVYSESCTQAFAFVSGLVDLINMQALDVIQIRIRKRIALGGNWIMIDEITYTGVQPAGHSSATIGPQFGIYDIEISARQTVGALRTLDAEFMDAKRVGLE